MERYRSVSYTSQKDKEEKNMRSVSNMKQILTLLGITATMMLGMVVCASAQTMRDDADTVATFRDGILTLGQFRSYAFWTRRRELTLGKDLAIEKVWTNPNRRSEQIRNMAFDTILGTYARENNVPMSAEQSAAFKTDRDEFLKRIYYEERIKPEIERERANFKPGYRYYYETHLDDFRLPDLYIYRQIVLHSTPEASPNPVIQGTMELALQRIADGEDFRSVADEISSATESPKGRSLGPIENSLLIPEFRVVLGRLELGQVSRVFRLGDGVAVVKLEERTRGEVKSYEEVLPTLQRITSPDRFMPERVVQRFERDVLSQYPFVIIKERISQRPEDAQAVVVSTELVKITNMDVFSLNRDMLKEEPDEKTIMGTIEGLYRTRLIGELALQEGLLRIPFFEQSYRALEDFHRGQSLLKEMVQGKRFPGLPRFTSEYMQTLLQDRQFTITN